MDTDDQNENQENTNITENEGSNLEHLEQNNKDIDQVDEQNTINDNAESESTENVDQDVPVVELESVDVNNEETNVEVTQDVSSNNVDTTMENDGIMDADDQNENQDNTNITVNEGENLEQLEQNNKDTDQVDEKNTINDNAESESTENVEDIPVAELESVDVDNEETNVEVTQDVSSDNVDTTIENDGLEEVKEKGNNMTIGEHDTSIQDRNFENKDEAEQVEEHNLADHTDKEDIGISVKVNVGNETDKQSQEEMHFNFDDASNIESEFQPISPVNSSTISQSTKTIIVTVTHNGVEKEIKVEILQAAPKKPFLGGFRHKIHHTEYLNASAQTYPKKINMGDAERFNRDTQTVFIKNQVQQTHNNTSTQMTKPGCYVSDLSDVVRIPGKYITADEMAKVKLEKILLLQTYWRRWLAKRYVDRLRNDRDLRIEWERVQEEQKAEEKVQRIQKEFERRMKPKSKADFDLLYAALERWRREEVERINETHSGPERKAALIGLLEQETHLIQSIERHRLNADQINSKENVEKFLNKAASSKVWRAYDGKRTEMNTEHTLRAQELRDLYNSLQMTYLTHDERLDVLLTLKHTVKEHDCKLTQEIMELIDREADLLTRGIKVGNLEGLRQRISTLFLQFCKTPLFNPEVARLLKVPQDSSKLRKDIYFCPSCNSYLPSTEFPLASNSRIVGRCKKCSQLDNNARLRHDFTKIRCIMQHLRRTEEAFDDGSKTAFIIQDADLRYLIENIWNSQSALSGLDELYDLVFVRWNKHEHWSPWNCVLLTKEEASSHTKIDNVVEAYGRIFIGKIHHRHVLARQYFSKLTDVADGGVNNKEQTFTSTQKHVTTVS